LIKRQTVAVAAVVILAAVVMVEARAGSTLDAAAYAPVVLSHSEEPTPTPAPMPTPTPTRPPNCHRSYPTVCIPPPPPDLDCPEVAPLVNFEVLPPDPHGFDANHNGIGCEEP
jgi:hypothetical protein